MAETSRSLMVPMTTLLETGQLLFADVNPAGEEEEIKKLPPDLLPPEIKLKLAEEEQRPPKVDLITGQPVNLSTVVGRAAWQLQSFFQEVNHPSENGTLKINVHGRRLYVDGGATVDGRHVRLDPFMARHTLHLNYCADPGSREDFIWVTHDIYPYQRKLTVVARGPNSLIPPEPFTGPEEAMDESLLTLRTMQYLLFVRRANQAPKK